MKRLFRPAVLTVVLLLMAACGSRASSAVPASGGGPVASFLKENKLEGQVVLVEFGTIGCELSNSGLDAMIDLQKRNAVPALAFARLEPIPDAKTFAEYYQQKSAPFPVVRALRRMRSSLRRAATRALLHTCSGAYAASPARRMP